MKGEMWERKTNSINFCTKLTLWHLKILVQTPTCDNLISYIKMLLNVLCGLFVRYLFSAVWLLKCNGFLVSPFKIFHMKAGTKHNTSDFLENVTSPNPYKEKKKKRN